MLSNLAMISDWKIVLPSEGRGGVCVTGKVVKYFHCSSPFGDVEMVQKSLHLLGYCGPSKK